MKKKCKRPFPCKTSAFDDIYQMCVRKQVKTLLKILSEAPSQQKHLGADTKHFQILKAQKKKKPENKSQNDKNRNTNRSPLFPLKMFLVIFRGARNISLAAGAALATGYLAARMSAVLRSCNTTSTASARSDINSHLSAGDGLAAVGTELVAGEGVSRCGTATFPPSSISGRSEGRGAAVVPSIVVPSITVPSATIPGRPRAAGWRCCWPGSAPLARLQPSILRWVRGLLQLSRLKCS